MGQWIWLALKNSSMFSEIIYLYVDTKVTFFEIESYLLQVCH